MKNNKKVAPEVPVQEPPKKRIISGNLIEVEIFPIKKELQEFIKVLMAKRKNQKQQPIDEKLKKVLSINFNDNKSTTIEVTFRD